MKEQIVMDCMLYRWISFHEDLMTQESGINLAVQLFLSEISQKQSFNTDIVYTYIVLQETKHLLKELYHLHDF